MGLRAYLLAFLTFGMALAMFTHFACMLVIGEFTISEHNTLILTAETILIAGICLFSLYTIIEQLRTYRSYHQHYK